MTIAYACGFQVDALERDAFEVLRLVRSLKNSLAPINRVPPELLSLIPDYCHRERRTDQDLIALTHVSRCWREIFISRSSLWTQLDFRNIDKTNTYIQRLRSSPFEIYLGDDENIDKAFPLITPHLRRLKSLTVEAYTSPSVLRHLRCHTPLLEKLDIHIAAQRDTVLDASLFNDSLSSLRELRLHGVTTHFPWKNLANLQVAELKFLEIHGTTQILNFLESAPLLHTVVLQYPMPHPPDSPLERMIPLRYLNYFSIATSSPSSILRHLHIPVGASLDLEFRHNGDESPLLDYLPERSPHCENLSHITTINLLFHPNQKFARFSGPSGSLRLLVRCSLNILFPTSSTIDRRILHSFGPSALSTTRRLTVSSYTESRPATAQECPVFRTLSSAKDLRNLTLINCNNRTFILALDPEQNPSGLVPCPNMKKLVLCFQFQDLFDVQHIIRMAKNRALRGVKLLLITCVDPRGFTSKEEVFNLREYVTRVEYKVDECDIPAWDDISGGSGGEGG